MLVLHLISYVAMAVAFLFITLSLASGLLYLAEIIEEHSITAKTVGQRTIYSIIFLHLVLHFFDGIPMHLTVLGIFCHLIYLTNFSSSWPFISLTSWKFVASCLLVIIDHFAYFNYFSQRAKSQRNSFVPGRIWEDKKSIRKAIQNDIPGFLEIASFFAIFVWLVPFFLFLSLSANDNVLPTDLKVPSTPAMVTNERNRPPALALPPQAESFRPAPYSGSIFRQLFAAVPLPALRRSRTSHRELDGLIAPPSPMIPKSPLASPSVPYGFHEQQGFSHNVDEGYFSSASPSKPFSTPLASPAPFQSPSTPISNSYHYSESMQKQSSLGVSSSRGSPNPVSTPTSGNRNYQQQFQKKRATLIETPSNSSSPRVRTSNPSNFGVNRKISNLPPLASSSLGDSNSSSSADEDSVSGGDVGTPTEFEVMGVGLGDHSMRLMASPALTKRKVM